MSNTQAVNDEVAILKLTNGEEIIGKAVIHEGVVTVKDALQIMLVPQPNNQMGMGMAPYMPYTSEFFIYANALVAIGEPNQDLLDSYNRHFSKIVLPPSGLVV